LKQPYTAYVSQQKFKNLDINSEFTYSDNQLTIYSLEDNIWK